MNNSISVLSLFSLERDSARTPTRLERITPFHGNNSRPSREKAWLREDKRVVGRGIRNTVANLGCKFGRVRLPGTGILFFGPLCRATCTQAVLRALSLHSLSDNTCAVPTCSFTLGSESPCANFLSAHTDLNISVDVLVEASFLSRPAHALTLCLCTANLFTIVTNQYGIISLSSSFLFSCLLSCKPRALNIM